MNFQPLWVSRGKPSLTTTGGPGSARRDSMRSNRRIRLISATYSAPSRNATPFGLLSPFATTITSVAPRSPSRLTTAYTFPSPRVPTKTVPRSPSVMERAPGTSGAYISIAKPGGSRIDFRRDEVSQAAEERNGKKKRNISKTGTVRYFLMGISLPRFPIRLRESGGSPLYERPLLDHLEECYVLEGVRGPLTRRFPRPFPDRIEEFPGVPDLLQFQGEPHPLVRVPGRDVQVRGVRVLPDVPVGTPLRHSPGNGVLLGPMRKGVDRRVHGSVGASRGHHPFPPGLEMVRKFHVDNPPSAGRFLRTFDSHTLREVRGIGGCASPRTGDTDSREGNTARERPGKKNGERISSPLFIVPSPESLFLAASAGFAHGCSSLIRCSGIFAQMLDALPPGWFRPFRKGAAGLTRLSSDVHTFFITLRLGTHDAQSDHSRVRVCRIHGRHLHGPGEPGAPGARRPRARRAIIPHDRCGKLPRGPGRNSGTGTRRPHETAGTAFRGGIPDGKGDRR